ncbi:hypothetical protein AB1Y20_006030 [Prymnesium parvum]|uniref:Fungal lipase-type domain-containing protein n=1 Tax=Prymnesium parvum TaxID=97485 RepID=A0AB34J1C6_PRYPA
MALETLASLHSLLLRLILYTLSRIPLLIRLWIALCRIFVSSVYRAIRRSACLKPIPPSDLDLPVLAARLSDSLYHVDSPGQVAASIKTLMLDSNLLHYEEQPLMRTNSVWCLFEGRRNPQAEKALFLVFRGTMSPTDAIADVMFRPEAGPNGVRCHGGFLRTVKEDSTLHARLAQHLPGAAQLYIFGHSLGGALAQTIAGAGFLPKGFTGQLTIVSLGGPVVFYGEPNVKAFDEPTAAARVMSIVNANDIVPRLLGCPLSFTRTVLSIFASSHNLKQRQQQEEVVDTLEHYRGFPGYELVFLYDGVAYKVPEKNRGLVLNLAEAISPRCIADHLTYVVAVEKAAGVSNWTVSTD